MNNYGWNLDSDYICHSPSQKGAHYSKNWTKQDQKEYNHQYYLNKTAKSISKTSKHITNTLGGSSKPKLEKVDKEVTSTTTLKEARNRVQEPEYYDEYGSRTSDPSKHYDQEAEAKKALSKSLKSIGSTLIKAVNAIAGNKFLSKYFNGHSDTYKYARSK